MGHVLLIVEHERNIAKDYVGISQVILPESWKITEINDFQKALLYLKENPVDILLTDVMFDHSVNSPDGLILAEQAHKRNNHVSVIVVSGYLGAFLSKEVLSKYEKMDIEYIDKHSPLKLLENQISRSSRKVSSRRLLTDLSDIWTLRPAPEVRYYCYMILTLGSIVDTMERTIASESLLFEHFYSHETRLFMCDFRQSDLFNFVVDNLQIVTLPALIVGSSPDMGEALVIGREPLLRLANDPADLRSFYFSLHVQLKNSQTLNSIKRQMRTQGFWREITKHRETAIELARLIATFWAGR